MIVVSLLLICVAVILLVTGLVQPSSALLSASIGTSLLAAVVLLVGARQSSAARRATGAAAPEAAPAAVSRDAGEPGRRDAVTVLERFDQADHRSADQRSADHRCVDRRATDRSARDYLAGDWSAEDAGVAGSVVLDQPRRSVAAVLSPPDASAIPQQGAPEPAGVVGAAAAGDGDPSGDPRGDGRDAGGWDAGGDAAIAADEDEDPPDEPAAQQVSAADAARVSRMTTEVLVVDGRPRYHLPGCVHLLGRESEPLPVSEAIDLGFTPCSLCEPDSALLADARRV